MTEDPGDRSSSDARGRHDGGDPTNRQTDRFEWWLRRGWPLLRDTDDPLFFLAICVLVFATLVALIVSLEVHDGDELRDVTFKVAGGVLVALGAYTAVRTIVSNRANSASQAFTSVLALLADDPRTADAARVAAIRHLPELARRRGADPVAIHAVIAHLEQSNSTPVKAAAVNARREFPKPYEWRAPDHRVRAF
jgi:hypothetical protein